MVGNTGGRLVCHVEKQCFCVPAVDLKAAMADSDVPKDARELRLVVCEGLRSLANDDHDRVLWSNCISGHEPDKIVSRKDIHSGRYTSWKGCASRR